MNFVVYKLQTYLGDIAGSVLDHRNKANITIKAYKFFGFLVHIKVMFIICRTNEQTTKQKQSYRQREQIGDCQRGGDGEERNK